MPTQFTIEDSISEQWERNFRHNSLHMVDAMFLTVAGCSVTEGAVQSDYSVSTKLAGMPHIV